MLAIWWFLKIPSFLLLKGRIISISSIHLFKCGLTDSYFILQIITCYCHCLCDVHIVLVLATESSSRLPAAPF